MSFIDYGDENVIKPKRSRILLVDGSNVLFQTSYEAPNGGEDKTLQQYEAKTGLEIFDDPEKDEEEYLIFKRNVFSRFLNMVSKYVKEHGCDQVYITFDTGKSWRVNYTKGELDGLIPLTKKLYKGKRRLDMTPKQERDYKRMKRVGNELSEFFKNHTGTKCFVKPILEADDMMSYIPLSEPQHDFIIMSTDSDLTQLMKHSNVQVYDLHHKKMREPCDVEWFLFEKCIRGDSTDNVQSALPRVRLTKIQEAYTDPYKRVNMMEIEWSDQDKNLFKVGDLFKENQLLMDLTKQPSFVVDILNEVINEEHNRSSFKNKIDIGKGMNVHGVEHLHKSFFSGAYAWLHGRV